jgi:hypothetical protein
VEPPRAAWNSRRRSSIAALVGRGQGDARESLGGSQRPSYRRWKRIPLETQLLPPYRRQAEPSPFRLSLPKDRRSHAGFASPGSSPLDAERFRRLALWRLRDREPERFLRADGLVEAMRLGERGRNLRAPSSLDAAMARVLPSFANGCLHTAQACAFTVCVKRRLTNVNQLEDQTRTRISQGIVRSRRRAR